MSPLAVLLLVLVATFRLVLLSLVCKIPCIRQALFSRVLDSLQLIQPFFVSLALGMALNLLSEQP